jgi:hypothetical protein
MHEKSFITQLTPSQFFLIGLDKPNAKNTPSLAIAGANDSPTHAPVIFIRNLENQSLLKSTNTATSNAIKLINSSFHIFFMPYPQLHSKDFNKVVQYWCFPSAISSLNSG